MSKLKIKLLADDVIPPEYATGGSAGMDLCAHLDEICEIEPGETLRVPTGIAIALPDANHVALVCARSGLSVKHGINLANSVGVIDSDYRGEIIVALFNQSDRTYAIEPGERIAQLLIMPVTQPEIEICDSLDETERGSGGFGSTGRI